MKNPFTGQAFYTFLGNEWSQWMSAIVIAAIVFFVLIFLRRIAEGRAKTFSQKESAPFREFLLEFIHSTKTWFFVAIAAFVGLHFLVLPFRLERVFQSFFIILFLIQITLWGFRVIEFLLRAQVHKQIEASGDASMFESMVPTLRFIGRVAFLALVLLLGLSNLGIDITALIAGVGVTGIAVALAVQNILGDLFASISILLDKPFVVGDFIVMDDIMGNVEKIGLKTTRIRSLSGEQLVISNGDLLNGRIRNFKRMQERRISFSFGVVYQTPYEKLKAIPAIVKESVEAQEGTRFDRAHFMTYGDFSLNFDVVYYVEAPDYLTYANVQQGINLELYRRFDEEGIVFAYPTQTLFLEGKK